MNRDPALETYKVESQDLLEQMEQGLLAFNQGCEDGETVNAIFRAAHTIKGSAGLFGLDDIVAFTHTVESVLDQVRDGRTRMDAALVELLLQSRDHMSHLVGASVDGEGVSNAMRETGAAIQAQLGKYLQAAGGSGSPLSAEAADGAGGVAGADDKSTGYWHVSVQFGHEVFRNGMDPLSFIRYLGQQGEIAGITTYPCAMPAADEMDPESCYLGFEIGLTAATTASAIEGAFEFVREDCRLAVLPPGSPGARYQTLADELLAHGVDLAETLSRQGIAMPDKQDASEADVPPPAAMRSVTSPETAKAGSTTQEHKPQEARFIRLDASKVDALINLVGQLVIAGAGIGMASRRAGDLDLLESSSTLSALVDEIRDRALQLRMVPIGATFNRFQRVVHDVSVELGKDIALVVGGADTELDKTMVERIGDPLTHLVRNAMDHGIEPTDVRLAKGKPARGTLRLNAFHDAGSVVIEVSDDGGGLDRERILAKARERGLVGETHSPSDAEVWNIIFEPGFSTAAKVSNLSGRGVGMDVVKRGITDLRGTIEIESVAGQGTTIRIRLPLTLAIIDGFMVGVGESVFVVPLDMVEQCLEFSAEAQAESRGRDYLNLRGKVLPFIIARELFGIGGAPGRRQNILVLRFAGQRVGLIVDELMGEAQTVIKPLGKLFRDVKGLSGSTILGDGRVALILDVPSLVLRAQQNASSRQLIRAAA